MWRKLYFAGNYRRFRNSASQVTEKMKWFCYVASDRKICVASDPDTETACSLWKRIRQRFKSDIEYVHWATL